MNRRVRSLLSYLSFLTVLSLAACGGGGGGGGAALPVALVQPAPAAGAAPTSDAPQGETPAGQPPAEAAPGTPPEVQPPVQPEPEPAAPVAVLPKDFTILTKSMSNVDGSASTGPKGSTLSYVWSLEAKPATSTAQLLDMTMQSASLYADVAGTYRLKLVVSAGGKASDPAYVNVEAIDTGSLAPFATFKASGLNTTDSAYVSGCAFYRSVANYASFWAFSANVYDLNCYYPLGSSVPDLQRQGMFGGGQLSYIAANLRYLQGGGISGASQVTWANVNTISGYGYALSAEPTELAKVPAGKATGSAFNHSMTAAYVQPFTTGQLQYKIEGALQPANSAPGWELEQEMVVVVTLEGNTFVNSQPGYESVKVFERTFTADFSETISLNLNWAQLPVAFETYASYKVMVTSRMKFKRTSE